MQSLFDVQKRLIPDLISVMEKRFHMLRSINYMEPVGRRLLAQKLGLSERVCRSEVTILNEQALIEITQAGMSVTLEGKATLAKLEGMMKEITGINDMETVLKEKMGIDAVVIIPGDSDKEPWLKTALGKTCAKVMKENLRAENIIAITGGTTIATVAEMLTPAFSKNKQIVFVPARGGIGEKIKDQANSICAKMAEKSSAAHRVLYVPDEVSKDMYQSFAKEPAIQEILTLIKSATMVLHGIGDAQVMANRRRTDETSMHRILDQVAVGEAFGYYFNENGEVVHKVPTIGFQLADLANIQTAIAVAGGASKAKAIQSYMKNAPPSTILITDEGAAGLLVSNLD